MRKLIETKELFDCQVPYLRALFQNSVYPWDLLPQIKAYITDLQKTQLYGFTEYQPGVLVGKHVRIAPTATLEGPCIIGNDCEIRPGAYLRGSVVTGANCVIGNSTELKNCILLDRVQVPHYNYVGDSILGNHAHMGAGAVCSNLKSDGKAVVIHGEQDYETGLRKIGGILGDHADVGCGSVLNPGTVIGPRTSVYPLTSLRGVYPADCIVKSTTEYVERRQEPENR